MANTITNLVPDLYAALDTVSREQVGFIPAVARNSTAERAAVGEDVRYPIAPSNTASDISPAMTIPEPTDQSIDSDTISITKAKAVEFGFVGETQRGLDNGPGHLTVQGDMIAQAMRALTNEVEQDLASAALAGTSRAYGTAGTTPFGTNTKDVAQLRKILMDNGSPNADLNLVLDTSAGANLRTLYGISTDRDWSSVPVREQGVLATPHGMSIRETGANTVHDAGTGASATTNAAGYAVGSTTITLASAGTGTILAGDVVSFAGDSNKYVVALGNADVSGGGSITLVEPGLKQAIPASATAITLSDTFSGGVAFYRDAIQLVTRAPALPKEGDAAIDSMMIQDPRSGLAFDVRVYGGYRKVRYELSLAWGWKVTQPRHTALLLG